MSALFVFEHEFNELTRIMSRRRDKSDDNYIWLLAIWSLLIMMMFQQCSHQDNIERELRDIKHEIHMLQYK